MSDPIREAVLAEFKAAQELARRNLLEFILYTKPDYDAGWFHHEVCRELDQFLRDVLDKKSPRLMLFAPPRHGKALHVDTPVFTPKGWTTMGELRVGDFVFGPDGKKTRVLAVSPVWKSRRVFKVTNDTNCSVIADEAHDWEVRLDRKHGAFTVRETRWLAERTSPRNPMVRKASPLHMPNKALPVPPYTLGVWLGDGNSTQAFFTQHEDDAAHVVARIEDEGFEVRQHTDPKNYGILGLSALLKEHGFIGNKHIPEVYMLGSIAQRTALLQGLVDTDGHVAPDGQVEFCNTNRELAVSVAQLVRSLGHKASVIEGRATLNGEDCGPKYRVMFYMSGAASLPRKAERCKDGVRFPNHYLTFEDAGLADTVCIEVEHPTHLFLVGEGMVPTHNSEIVSRRFPAYAFGIEPNLSMIATSYNSDLASAMNRDVQKVIDQAEYAQLFPKTRLSGSAVRTVTGKGTYLRNSDNFEIVDAKGSYKSAGVGAGVTGRGGRILIIDDPVKDAAEALSDTTREAVWNWYTSTLYTRCEPGGGILVIMCMTGDTPVLRPDGTETPLRDIKVGDKIATYEDGSITVSTVRNWINQGPDNVYTISLESGRIVKANERHPFLVRRNGALEWVRLRNLKVGDKIVSARAPGAESHAPLTDATSQLVAKGCAGCTTESSDGQTVSVRPQSMQSHEGLRGSSTDTESRPKNSLRFSNANEVSAPSAEKLRAMLEVPSIGGASSVSIITPIQVKSEVCSATLATSPSDAETTRTQSESFSPLLSTYAIADDAVVGIEAAGCEDVFDIEVERTANFIANGLVSHNTRWHEDDLAGRILKSMESNKDEEWRVVRYPAVAEEDEVYRRKGQPLHAARYNLKRLRSIRAAVGERVWVSLYQQRPTAADGTIFLRENWKRFPVTSTLRIAAKYGSRQWWMEHLRLDGIIQAWDTALGIKRQNDYSACATLGFNEKGYYLLEMFQAKMESPDLKRAVKDQYHKWRPSVVIVEGGGSASGKMTVQELGRDSNLPLREVVHSTDKVLRANLLSPTHEAGHVYVPEEAPWVHDFIESCSKFPNAAHDDDVDAFMSALDVAINDFLEMRIADDEV